MESNSWPATSNDAHKPAASSTLQWGSLGTTMNWMLINQEVLQSVWHRHMTSGGHLVLLERNGGELFALF
ncbi:hypothetical protein GJAV_G00044610 [Gymnothorax javanicus]|nr:hypothetical protein GJAV_G00044610 [Gymnothorax javanicus]